MQRPQQQWHCFLQEALANPKVSNAELLDSLSQWADAHGDAERTKLLSKKPVRDAVAARIQQVSCAAMQATAALQSVCYNKARCVVAVDSDVDWP